MLFLLNSFLDFHLEAFLLYILLISRHAHGSTAELEESLQTCSVTIPLTDLSLADCATSMVSTFGVMNHGANN